MGFLQCRGDRRGSRRCHDITITIHNSCVGLSALCHLVGVVLSLRPRQTLHPPAVWLPAAYTLAVGAVGLVALSARQGWIPVFFIQGQGGTPLRQLVLLSAMVIFALTAALLRTTSRRPLSAFAYWYALALTLIAVGLGGVMLPVVPWQHPWLDGPGSPVPRWPVHAHRRRRLGARVPCLGRSPWRRHSGNRAAAPAGAGGRSDGHVGLESHYGRRDLERGGTIAFWVTNWAG